MRTLGINLLLVACMLGVTPVHAELLDTVQRLRQQSCPQSTRELPRLQRTAGLDAVAREWSKGGTLPDAASRAAYRSSKVASLQAQGVRSEREAAEILKEYCAVLTDPRYSEVGLFRRDARVWIVLAAPLALPPEGAAERFQDTVLELVNRARSQVRDCGSSSFGPAAALSISPLLTQAAAAHAQDMARHGHSQHQGSDGSTPSERVTRTGYRWSRIAENVAAGLTTPQAVMESWLASPGHCSNIMRSEFTEMGVAYATAPNSSAGIYWTQVFGTPASGTRR